VLIVFPFAREGGAGFRRNHPLPPQVGLNGEFLSASDHAVAGALDEARSRDLVSMARLYFAGRERVWQETAWIS
jgi:hypothetical protein